MARQPLRGAPLPGHSPSKARNQIFFRKSGVGRGCILFLADTACFISLLKSREFAIPGESARQNADGKTDRVDDDNGIDAVSQKWQHDEMMR